MVLFVIRIIRHAAASLLHPLNFSPVTHALRTVELLDFA